MPKKNKKNLCNTLLSEAFRNSLCTNYVHIVYKKWFANYRNNVW